jgi:hypothetical protein
MHPSHSYHRDSLDAAYNSENPKEIRAFRAETDADYSTVDIDVEGRNKDVTTLCPFDGSKTCKSGCMACDAGVTCCEVGDSCTVTMESQTPCPFVSYMPSCMMCDNAKGEPTLVSSKPGDTCTATTFCTSFSKWDTSKPRRPHKRPPLQLSSSGGDGAASSAFMVGSRGARPDVGEGAFMVGSRGARPDVGEGAFMVGSRGARMYVDGAFRVGTHAAVSGF